MKCLKLRLRFFGRLNKQVNRFKFNIEFKSLFFSNSLDFIHLDQLCLNSKRKENFT